MYLLAWQERWLSFRDVFDELFSGPVAMMVSTAEQFADEGDPFNRGSVHRTLNTPLAALAFLNPEYQANLRGTAT